MIGEFDDLAGFVIPLCVVSHTNASKYCSVSTYWNRILWSTANLPRSIFRHLPTNEDPQVHNWMMDLYEIGEGGEWDNVILDLEGGSHFWLTLISGGHDPTFQTNVHTLLLTVTLKLQDTMHVCMDTCFWPPSSILKFSRGDAKEYIPRLGNEQTVPDDYTVCFPKTSQDVREIEGSDITKPTDFTLSQNYPNPFNPATNFQFTVSKSAHVKIEIFNIVGQKVTTLVDESKKPGVYSADWNGKDANGNSVSSGVYFYRMQAGDFSDMKKMVLIK